MFSFKAAFIFFLAATPSLAAPVQKITLDGQFTPSMAKSTQDVVDRPYAALQERAAPPTAADVHAAAQAVAAAVGEKPYALVGGGACLLLGGTRLTEDIDIVVPKGQTPATRSALQASGKFTIDPRTRHTTFGPSNVEIEILSPPMLFQEPFDETTPTVVVGGVKVLHPLLLLNAKCRSVLGRSTDAKKATDSQDISFLLQYLAAHKIAIKQAEVPNASPEFVEHMIQTGAVPKQLWNAAGFVDGKGWPQ